MVVTMLWILVFFVAVVANVGQAVNRRIALQMVADAGAYTGGAVMATGWNHLAYWNRHIQRMASWVMISSDDFTVNICGCNLIGICDEMTIPAYAAAHGFFQAENFKFGSLLKSEPRRVSDFNIRDLFPGEDPNTFDFAHSDMSGDARLTNVYGVAEINPLVATVIPSDADAETDKPLWDDETFFDWIPDPFFSTSSDISPRTWTSVCFPESWDTTLPVFWWKLARFGSMTPAYHFIYEVKSPPTKAIMFDSIIGPNAIPQMKAVAVTKPVGDRNRRGEIERGDIGYLVRLVRVSSVMLGNTITDSFYKAPGGPQKKVTH